MSMRSTFDQELTNLRDMLVRLGDMVDVAIGRAMQSLQDHDRDLAQQVIHDDQEINDLRFEIEEKCMNLIVRQQPAARDLRFIVAAMNVVLDLERMGDHAAGVATIVQRAGDEPLKPPTDLFRMAETVREILRESLESLMKADAEAAHAITGRDEEVDDFYNVIFRDQVSSVGDDPQAMTRATYLIFCAHNLERIADRVTNICERVIFFTTGRMEEISSREKGEADIAG